MRLVVQATDASKDSMPLLRKMAQTHITDCPMSRWLMHVVHPELNPTPVPPSSCSCSVQGLSGRHARLCHIGMYGKEIVSRYNPSMVRGYREDWCMGVFDATGMVDLLRRNGVDIPAADVDRDEFGGLGG